MKVSCRASRCAQWQELTLLVIPRTRKVARGIASVPAPSVADVGLQAVAVLTLEKRAPSHFAVISCARNPCVQEGLLDGHLALITGSSTGIGAAIAVAFARQGAKLVITAEPEQQENLDKARHSTVLRSRTSSQDQGSGIRVESQRPHPTLPCQHCRISRRAPIRRAPTFCCVPPCCARARRAAMCHAGIASTVRASFRTGLLISQAGMHASRERDALYRARSSGPNTHCMMP